jgi:hypothetical protein
LPSSKQIFQQKKDNKNNLYAKGIPKKFQKIKHPDKFMNISLNFWICFQSK